METMNYNYGVIGLGTMGRNLAYNICDKGFSVAGFDSNEKQVEILTTEGECKAIVATSNLEEFAKALSNPKVIIMLVPAGEIVDKVIDELIPFLSKDDILMDCGNSHFTDTSVRTKKLLEKKINFLGVGISGGESGARYGPSIMPGGSKEAYAHIAGMLEAISAKVKGEPCVRWLGNDSAGHYVKMVHNGIEYGLMQLISEAYHLLKVIGGMHNDQINEIFSKWNTGILQSFLIEITSTIFVQRDDLTNNRLIDMILDSAHQKGTGGWTSEDAMKLQVPIPVIDIAVSMRDMSAYKKERIIAQQTLLGPDNKFSEDKNELVAMLEQALYFSMITTYAQGMTLLHFASKDYKFNLKLIDIASIWRGGCIIRSALLEDICSAFSKQADLESIMLDSELLKKLIQSQIGIRKAIQTGVENGIPIPALMGSLAYYDSYRNGWLPANLIQAQRDYFGAHTYERNDREGNFHTNWNQAKE